MEKGANLSILGSGAYGPTRPGYYPRPRCLVSEDSDVFYFLYCILTQIRVDIFVTLPTIGPQTS